MEGVDRQRPSRLVRVGGFRAGRKGSRDRLPVAQAGRCFSEALTAKHLYDEGYTSWQGRLRCRLFHTPNFADAARAETTKIERLLSKADLPIPRDYERRLDFIPLTSISLRSTRRKDGD